MGTFSTLIISKTILKQLIFVVWRTIYNHPSPHQKNYYKVIQYFSLLIFFFLIIAAVSVFKCKENKNDKQP